MNNNDDLFMNREQVNHLDVLGWKNQGKTPIPQSPKAKREYAEDFFFVRYDADKQLCGFGIDGIYYADLDNPSHGLNVAEQKGWLKITPWQFRLDDIINALIDREEYECIVRIKDVVEG